MKRLAIISIFIFVCIGSWAQSNLTEAEYFFDSDPGMGGAIPIAGFATSTTIDVNDMIDVSGLPIGMHTLGIRVMDDNNVWSMAEYIPIFVTLASANIASNLTAAEYFFDIDPGMGSGTAITLTSSQNIDINDMFPTSALSLGMHTLNIRIRNEFNERSMVESIPIFVTQASALAVEDIDQVEYFFDIDPGIGIATPLVITASQSIDINDLIPTGALSIGMHVLNIRIRTTNGEWSLVESVPVFINHNNLITQLEHFVDTDPGVGAADNIAITPPTNILDEDIIVPTGALGLGSHTMNVRIGGATIWGQTESVTFNICSGADADFIVSNTCIGDATNFSDTSTGVIGGDNYFWDFDNDGATDDVTNGDVSFTYTSPGSYTAELLIDRAGCEGYRYATIDVVDMPTANAGSNASTCIGNTVSLTGSIGASATTSLWSSSGTGTFDDPNLLSPIYTPSTADESAGSITLTLTASESFGTCVDATSQTTISIEALPTVNAGVNQTFCSNTLTLNGTIGGSATNSTWTSDGSGVFVDAANISTSYTPSPADIVAGSVVFTLTASTPSGSCSDVTSQTIITLIEAPTADAGSDQAVCNGDVITLTGIVGGGATTNQWTTNGTGSFANDINAATVYTPSASDISTGMVILTLSASEPSTTCSVATSQINVAIEALPTSTAGVDQTICSDQTLTLSGSIGGSAVTSAWTSDGSGTFVDATAVATTYTPSIADILAGSVILTLTSSTSSGACADATSQINIIISEAVAVDAGGDLSICSGQVANLSGTTSGDIGIQAWSSTGTGTFSNSASVSSTYTPSVADIDTGVIMLTLTATGTSPCADRSSSITLTLNGSIQVAEQNSDASIGTPININLLAGATTSSGSGDVLTTTIVSSPTKGEAILMADGTVTYTASENTIGLDVIEFQVCNQCGNCDTENAMINILNEVPTINVPPVTASSGGIVTVELLGQLFDLNDNIDLSSLSIVSPPISGANATIETSGSLNIDYSGVSFSGTDQLTIGVCDLSGACTDAVIFIEVSDAPTTNPPIVVYNAVSPNDDGKHDFFEIENIEFYSGNKVVIFNRWGDVVFEVVDYGNATNSFVGNSDGGDELPAGTYYYTIDTNIGDEPLMGFIMLNK